MPSNRVVIAAAALATIVAALAAGGQAEAKYIPTARNDWRIKCSNGQVIGHFYGTYGQAQNASVCAPGYIVGIWDNGLVAFGHTPRFGARAMAPADPGPAKSEPAAPAEASAAPRR
jgi:hypothetical protein